MQIILCVTYITGPIKEALLFHKIIPIITSHPCQEDPSKYQAQNI